MLDDDLDLGDLVDLITIFDRPPADLEIVEVAFGQLEICDAYLECPQMFPPDDQPGLTREEVDMMMLRASAQVWAWTLPPEV